MGVDYVQRTTKLFTDEVNINKIYTNKYDALQGLNNVTITENNQSWKSEKLRYEIHDDGSVLIYNDGVPIGWSTIEELGLDTTKTMEQKEAEHASKEQQRRNAENQAAKEKAGAMAQEEERRNAGTSSNEGKTPEEIEAAKAARAQQKKNAEVADVNVENVDNKNYSHTLDDFEYQQRTEAGPTQGSVPSNNQGVAQAAQPSQGSIPSNNQGVAGLNSTYKQGSAPSNNQGIAPNSNPTQGSAPSNNQGVAGSSQGSAPSNNQGVAGPTQGSAPSNNQGVAGGVSGHSSGGATAQPGSAPLADQSKVITSDYLKNQDTFNKLLETNKEIGVKGVGQAAMAEIDGVPYPAIQYENATTILNPDRTPRMTLFSEMPANSTDNSLYVFYDANGNVTK